MNRLWVWDYRYIATSVAVLVLMCLSVQASAQPESRKAYVAAIAALSTDPFPNPTARAAVNNLLQQSGTNESLARVIENPAYSISAAGSVGFTRDSWLVAPSLQFGRESGRNTAGFTLSSPESDVGAVALQVKFDPDDKKPTLSAVFAVGPKIPVAGGDLAVQRVFSVKFQYHNKYDYLTVLGIDGRTIPGTGMVLNLINRKAIESANVPATASAVQAASHEIQRALIPQIFQSALQFENVTVGNGYQVTLEKPLLAGGKGEGIGEFSGSRSVIILNQERLEPGQTQSNAVKFDEVQVSVGIDAKIEAGHGKAHLGKLSAEGSVTLSYSTDPENQNEGIGEERRKLAEFVREGRLSNAGALATNALAPWQHADSLSLAVNSVRRAFTDEAAKGVNIHFDDNLLASLLQSASLSEDRDGLVQLADALAHTADTDARAAIAENYVLHLKTSFLASRPHRTLGALTLVSLRSLVTAAEPYDEHWNNLPEELRNPGRITRIVGFQLDSVGDDILLIGEVIPGAPTLTIDDLTVGVRTVWKNGDTPLCSLDPDSADVGGAQHVRVIGVPGDSGFARVMLDADYLMKRVMGGLVSVEFPGYHSYKDLLRNDIEHGQTSEVANRFWFYPSPLQTGDIEESTDGSVVLFNAGVQVLSEQMVLAHEGLLSTGTVNATADRAAAEFTQALPDLEASHVEFRHLHGLFDIVLLAKTWQRLKLDSQWIERLADLHYTRVDVPSTYIGIKVVVKEGYLLQGGVGMRLSAGPHAWLMTNQPEVSALRAAVAKGSGQVLRPVTATTIVLPVGSPRSAGTLDAATVLALLRRGDTAQASAELRKLIKADPYDPESWCLQAMIDLQQRSYNAAIADAGYALQLDPENPDTELVAGVVRFQSHQLTGQIDAALQDIDIAIHGFPDSPRAHILKGDALLELDRTAEARVEYQRALELDPSSVMGNVSLGLLDVYEGWVVKGKKRIEKARVQAGIESNVPAVKAALAEAELGVAVLGDADAHIEAAQQDATDVLADPASDPQSRLQALLALAGISLMSDDRQAAEVYLRQALVIAPFNPEPLLTMANWAHERKQDDVARSYLNQAEKIAPDYPAIQEMRRKLGTQP